MKNVKKNQLKWFKVGNRYGCRWSETGEVAIPAVYGFPPHFNRKGYAVVWKDYKAGVIDENNNVYIPFIYDEIHERPYWVPNENRVTYIDENGEEKFKGPERVLTYRGYACFTNEGGQQAYDEDCNPVDFDEVDDKYMHNNYEWSIPENANRTIEEIEQALKVEFRKLQNMQCLRGFRRPWSRLSTKEIDEQEDIVEGYIYDRRYVMNQSWVHSRENAERIARTNNLLMRAVRKAVKLGKKTQESVKWMKDVPNNYEFAIRVYIYPVWENDKSCYGYKPKEGLSRSKEQDRLIDQFDNEADNHVWNILAAMGRYPAEDGVALCFDNLVYDADDKWDYKELIMDDGQTWDENIHFPAYMDVYFTHPFHMLYCDNFHFSFEDICNINDFRVNVAVKLETKEQSRCRL